MTHDSNQTAPAACEPWAAPQLMLLGDGMSVSTGILTVSDSPGDSDS